MLRKLAGRALPLTKPPAKPESKLRKSIKKRRLRTPITLVIRRHLKCLVRLALALANQRQARRPNLVMANIIPCCARSRTRSAAAAQLAEAVEGALAAAMPPRLARDMAAAARPMQARQQGHPRLLQESTVTAPTRLRRKSRKMRE